MKQMTLSTSGFDRYGKTTRRAAFLAEMERVVPWHELCALIEPFYPKPGNGRRPIGLERMLRIYFLQQWFNLSDPAVEEALYDSLAMRSFVGIDLGREPVPDETTACKFRHLLEKHEIGRQLFEQVHVHLEKQGIKVSTGTIVDATIISAPSSTKNAAGERDPDMHQTKKGKQWYFGMKVHTGTDTESGLVHTVVGTAANVADINVLGELLHGGEHSLHGDSAYHSKELKAQAEASGLAFNVNQRGTRSKPLTKAQRKRNRCLSRVRATVEHPFLVVKHLWGHAKVRYRGIKKNLAQMYTLFALANVFRVRRQLMST